MTVSSTSTTAPIPTSETRAFLSLAREILHQMAVLIRNSYLHDLTNEVFTEPLEKAQTALEEVMAVEGSFRLERSGQEFYANTIRVRMEIRNLHAYKYVWNELEKRSLGGFNFETVPSVKDLSRFLSVLANARSATEASDQQINLALQGKGVICIQALAPRLEEDEGPDEQSDLDRRQRAIHAYEQVLDFIRESMTNLDSPAQLNVRQAKRSVQRLVDLSYEEGEGFSLAGMAAIKSHDNYTFNHMVNVCVLAIAFGQRLGLKKQDLAQLGLCALYHDMGKLHIPLEMLNKHTSLTEEEWAVMGDHTVYAARTLFPLIELDHGTLHRILAALQHHYGVDGNGYPKLRLTQRQSLYAKIIAVVDTFDAMTTRRIYQRQFLPDEAMSILIKRSGSLYDPHLVKAFINCMGIFPVGSTVLLTTGELAVVVESNPDPDRVHQPKVKVVADVEKKLLASVILVDLSQPIEAHRAIVKCVDPEPFGINSAHYVV